MRRLSVFSLLVLAAGIVSGCGDPAPSTPVAPDQKLPDVSKMSPQDVDKMLKQDHEAGRK